MKDAFAFGLGALALLVGSVGMWISFGTPDWSLLGRAAPVVLIVIGLTMLFGSRHHHDSH